MQRSSDSNHRMLVWLLAAAALLLPVAATDAQGQVVFRETFGTAGAQLPTATSTADGNWTSAACLNGSITSNTGDSPSDDGTGSTHFLFHNTANCAYVAGEAVWRTVGSVPVQPFTTYVFSYAVKALNLTNPPGLSQVVTPNAGGSITVNSTTTPNLVASVWVQHTTTFTTGAATSSVELRITNTQTDSVGNDFGLDDIILFQPQQPLATCTADETRATERHWFFGVNGGIDFGLAGTTATPVLGSQTSVEGSTVITDVAGNLLFWSNGLTVFNRNHAAMPNGTGLIGNQSATQTVAAFPSLSEAGRYFVVSTSGASEVGGTGELHYSLVDMSLNGGLGDVTATKNVQLGADDSSSEALTAVRNADGTGFWVLTFTANTPNILAYEFDGNGPVSGTAVVSPMSTNNGSRFATLNFSADLTQLVQQTGNDSGSLPQVRLLDFDAATGQVTERFTWTLPTGAGTGTHGYSADFSPGGDYVYATKIFAGGQLYRYLIAGATTAAEVVATMEQLGGIGSSGGQVRRAPDGRMYVANSGGTALSVVNDPDNAGAPGFVAGGFALPAGSASRFGLPQTVTGCPPPLPPELQIVKSVSEPAVTPGDNFTYTLQVTNNGALPAHNLVTTDVLPNQVTFVSSAAGCTASGQTVTCTTPELIGGASVVYDIVVQLDPAYTGDGSDILNSASVTMDEDDPMPNNNTSPPGAPPVGPAQADVAIVKDVSADEVAPGGEFKYVILVSNQGPSVASDVVVTDTLPASVTFVSSPEGCTAVGQDVTCPTLTTLNVGDSQTYNIFAELDAAYRGDGSDLPNAAGVETATTDPTPGNNTSDPVFPNAIDPLTDIAVAASASTPATVPGDVVTVTIEAQNLGPQDATGVVLTVPLPSGVTLEGTPPAGYDAATGLWTIGALPNGGEVALALTLRIATAGALAVTATRTAIDQIDSNPDNDTATAALTSKPWSTFEADLVLTASSSPAVADPGAVLTYALVGVNRGPTYVLDLFIEGELPAGTTFEAVTPSAGGVCTAPAPGSAGMVTCTWPGATLLDAGASRTAQLQVRVAADATPGSSIIGAFHVSSLAAEYYEPSNNAVVVTAVSDGTTADLALSGLMLSEGVIGTALPLPLGVATPMRFTVTNQGPQATMAARYTIEVPETDIAGLQILSASVSQGAVTLMGTAAADWQVGPLGPGESAMFDLTVAMQSMRATTLSMRRVDSLPGDPNSANDTAELVLDGTGDPSGGERWTAIGNVDGAGLAEIIVGAGRLETPLVRIFTGDGQDTGLRFYAYDRNFVGGVRVAACDVNGDGVDEIITAPGIGPGPHVRVMSVAGETVDEMVGFYAFDPLFVGGVSVACADIDGDGNAEVVAAMETLGNEVRVFDVGVGTTVEVAAFSAYEEGFTGGVRVAALATSDPGGSQYQIVAVPGAGRPLELRAWAIGEGSAALVRTLPLTGPEYQLGAFVDVADINDDGQLDALVATDQGIVSSVGASTIDSGQFIGIFQPFGSSFLGGARVTLGDIDANGEAELLISQGFGGRPVVDAYTFSSPAAFVFRITSIELP